jgi:hypothetical protein
MLVIGPVPSFNGAMTDQDLQKLRAMYDAAFSAIKTWIDSRYRMFQFVCVLAVGSITLGLQALSNGGASSRWVGLGLSLVNLLAALIGLRTELSNRVYNVASFAVLNDIEQRLNQDAVGQPLISGGGPFTRPREKMHASWVAKTPNVDYLHMLFYVSLFIFWFVLAIRSFN